MSLQKHVLCSCQVCPLIIFRATLPNHPVFSLSTSDSKTLDLPGCHSLLQTHWSHNMTNIQMIILTPTWHSGTCFNPHWGRCLKKLNSTPGLTQGKQKGNYLGSKGGWYSPYYPHRADWFIKINIATIQSCTNETQAIWDTVLVTSFLQTEGIITDTWKQLCLIHHHHYVPCR